MLSKIKVVIKDNPKITNDADGKKRMIHNDIIYIPFLFSLFWCCCLVGVAWIFVLFYKI